MTSPGIGPNSMSTKVVTGIGGVDEGSVDGIPEAVGAKLGNEVGEKESVGLVEGL